MSRNQTVGPVSVPVSSGWGGADGRWSTFIIRVGTPGQTVFVLPFTSSNSINPVLPEGCQGSSDKECGVNRGYLFTPNISSTWDYIGLYTLAGFEEIYLGYTDENVKAGLDTVSLGPAGSGLPELQNQIIEPIAKADAFYVGALGLNNPSVNFTTLDNGYPSFLSALYTAGTIPSLSWAYTAGAAYRSPQGFGSLILGGYDASRLVPNNISFPFGPDPYSAPLALWVQSISFGVSSTLLPSPIFTVIDSAIPHIWLPTAACALFEQAFNLTWNDTANLYTLSDSEHQRLSSLNPTIAFDLGPASDGPFVTIKLPYAAFDLEVFPPLIDSPTRYFPLKRADNSTQYAIGRVLLQEATIISDWGRTTFSIHQADFSSLSNSSAPVPILPPGETINHATMQLQRTSFPADAIVGIAIGSVAVATLLAALFIHMLRMRKKKSVPSSQPSGLISSRPTWSHSAVSDLRSVSAVSPEADDLDLPVAEVRPYDSVSQSGKDDRNLIRWLRLSRIHG